MSSTDVVILGAARTPHRPLRRHASRQPIRLSSARARRARRSSAPASTPADVDEVIIGHGRQAGSGPNPARQVGRRAGLPDSVPAQTINQACASGLQAVALGAQAIQLGQSNVVLAGGIESMSRMPYLVDSEDARWGHKMGNFTLVDAMYRDGFFCPLSDLIMGQTAEVLARQYGITREESDAYALESQQRARRRRSPPAGSRTRSRPRRARTRRASPSSSTVDEHPRAGATIEGLRKLPLVFEPVDGQPGIITAGSSSGITDGGAAVVLTSADDAEPARPHAARAHRRLGDGRRRSAHHGHRPGAGDPQAPRRARASRSTTSIWSS